MTKTTIEPLVNGGGSNKENHLIEEPIEATEGEIPAVESAPAAIATKNSKNRKKKKSKKKSGGLMQDKSSLGEVQAEVVEEVITAPPPPPKKVEGISEELFNELTQDGKEKLLYDEVSVRLLT